MFEITNINKIKKYHYYIYTDMHDKNNKPWFMIKNN